MFSGSFNISIQSCYDCCTFPPSAFPLHFLCIILPRRICPVVILLQKSLSPVVPWALEKSPPVIFKRKNIYTLWLSIKVFALLSSWLVPFPIDFTNSLKWTFFGLKIISSLCLNKTCIRSNTLNRYLDFKNLMYVGPTVYFIPWNDISRSRTPINIGQSIR